MTKEDFVYVLFILSHTDKIFFKTPITTSFGLESVYFGEVFFEWGYEIIDIFSYKYFQHKISSFFEENLGNIENSEIEFYRSVLVYASHTSCGWRNIRGDEIKLSDIQTIKICPNFFIFKNTLLKNMNIGMTKIRIDFLNIYTYCLVIWFDYLRNHLKKTSRCCGNIENIHFWFYNSIFFLNFNQFKCTSCSESEFFCLFKIGVVDDKWFGHIC